MILFIVTDTRESFDRISVYGEKRNRLEAAANDYCNVVHYSEVTPELLACLQPWAICHSGGTDSGGLDLHGFRTCVLEWDCPQIGFCAGHQLSGKLFGGEIGPMRSLLPSEPDPVPDWFPGQYKERGFYSVRTLQPDPLFEGLSSSLNVWQNHRYHLTELSASLVTLATSENCPVEAWKHRDKPFYGVQFHPENYDADHPDGQRILENFFRIAREAKSLA